MNPRAMEVQQSGQWSQVLRRHSITEKWEQ